MPDSDLESDLSPLVENLTTSLDALSLALAPLLKTSLPTLASSLPLLDKAKLYILYTYTIESVLFSALTISGVNAKEHAVYRELTRVRQYFEKVKEAEENGGIGGGEKSPNMRLDKAAAGRMIKAGLSGNDRYDRDREERLKREKEGAEEKLKVMSGKAKRKAEGEVGSEGGDSQSDPAAKKKKKKSKKAKRSSGEDAATATDVSNAPVEEKKTKKSKHNGEKAATTTVSPSAPVEEKSSSKKKKSKHDRVKSNVAPKSAHDVFKGLLKGKKDS